MHPVKYGQGVPAGLNGYPETDAAVAPLRFKDNWGLGDLITQMVGIYQYLQIKGELLYQNPGKNPAQDLGLKQLQSGLGIVTRQVKQGPDY